MDLQKVRGSPAHGRRAVAAGPSKTLVKGPHRKHTLYVLETLGKVYANDRAAKDMDPERRMKLHQARSAPLLNELHAWLEAQLKEKRTEENSGLGKAMRYLLNHWQPLTRFLRTPGAPIDNNIAERALKKSVLHRKNALFYRTLNGAGVGDLFMSLIHTCELNEVGAFDYLTELQRHAVEMRADPAAWLPWNYQATLARGPDAESH